MFPWFRLLRIALGQIGGKRIDILSTSRVCLRVWPNDLDMNLHVNNGRYLALADIGRLHWFAATGALRLAREHRVMPIAGDAIAKFRRSLTCFQAFEIHTRLLGWDNKWGYLEHRFVRNNRTVALVAARGSFKGTNGMVEPATFLAELIRSRDSPQMPDWINRFRDGVELLSENLRDEERVNDSAIP